VRIYQQALCPYDLDVEVKYFDKKHSIENDETLFIDGFESYVDNAKRQYHLYCNRLQQILDLYDYSTEAELITGCQPLVLDFLDPEHIMRQYIFQHILSLVYIECFLMIDF
jgi:hypothetical protein